MSLILASQSARRQELLSREGYTFSVIAAQKDEIFDPRLDIDSALEQVAWSKAREIQLQHPQDWILAADTIVYFNGEILGKPADEKEACDMLADLSGSKHQVKTGVCILTPEFEITFTKTTDVYFRELGDEEILSYVQSGKPLDKAGAYGIQETDFVDHIDGSYTNVVGLPMSDVKMVLDLLHVISVGQKPPAYYFA